MRKTRFTLALLAAALMTLAAVAPATADPIGNLYDKLLGCEGYLQWPCPGPVIW